MSVIYVRVNREGNSAMPRYSEESVEAANISDFVEHTSQETIPLETKFQESTGEFDLFFDTDSKVHETNIVMIHTLPERFDYLALIQDLSEHYNNQVGFIRLIRRDSLYPTHLSNSMRVRKESLVHTPLISIIFYFKTTLEARNFYERLHNTRPEDCVNSIYCIYLKSVQISLKFEYSIMEEDQEMDKLDVPKKNLIQLPYCIKCLLRLDELFSGIYIQGSYREDRLWTESSYSCYTCKILALKSPTCSVCHTDKDIWVCLLCSYSGCGRYEKGHSLAHYIENSHNFSVGLQDKIIWSYSTDSFVHRIPGKTIWKGEYNEDSESGSYEKLPSHNDLLESNISALLCEQLDMQRNHYEALMEEKREKLRKELAENSDKAVKQLSDQKDKLVKDILETRNQIMNLRKGKVQLEKKIATVKAALDEEDMAQKTMESHITYMEEEEDSVCLQLDQDIKTQKSLLESFEKKLAEMYQQLE